MTDIVELAHEYERARQCKQDIWDQLKREGKTNSEAFTHPLYVKALNNARYARARLKRCMDHR